MAKRRETKTRYLKERQKQGGYYWLRFSFPSLSIIIMFAVRLHGAHLSNNKWDVLFALLFSFFGCILQQFYHACCVNLTIYIVRKCFSRHFDIDRNVSHFSHISHDSNCGRFVTNKKEIAAISFMRRFRSFVPYVNVLPSEQHRAHSYQCLPSTNANRIRIIRNSHSLGQNLYVCSCYTKFKTLHVSIHMYHNACMCSFICLYAWNCVPPLMCMPMCKHCHANRKV